MIKDRFLNVFPTDISKIVDNFLTVVSCVSRIAWTVLDFKLASSVKKGFSGV